MFTSQACPADRRASLAEQRAQRPEVDVEVGGGEVVARLELVDLLDRLLGTGVVLAGDIVISLSGVDLVQVRLHALITTIRDDMMEPR